jgi:hypothetical protein
MENLFSNLDLKLLEGILGSRFECVLGPTLGPELVSDLVVVRTSAGDLGIQGDISQFDFEAFDGVFSILRLSNTTGGELSETKNNTNRNFSRTGEIVSNILILRDEITFFENNQHPTKYISDSGLILELEYGSIAITKLGYHDELLTVIYLEKLDISEIPTPTSGFMADSLAKITIDRKFLSLEDAAGPQSH